MLWYSHTCGINCWFEFIKTTHLEVVQDFGFVLLEYFSLELKQVFVALILLGLFYEVST